MSAALPIGRLHALSELNAEFWEHLHFCPSFRQPICPCTPKRIVGPVTIVPVLFRNALLDTGAHKIESRTNLEHAENNLEQYFAIQLLLSAVCCGK